MQTFIPYPAQTASASQKIGNERIENIEDAKKTLEASNNAEGQQQVLQAASERILKNSTNISKK